MSIDPQRLRELCEKGLSPVQIATRLGVSLSGAHQALKRHGLVAAVGKKTGFQGSSSVRNA
jgi:orotate phosphoribosyltransferase-like protein